MEDFGFGKKATLDPRFAGQTPAQPLTNESFGTPGAQPPIHPPLQPVRVDTEPPSLEPPIAPTYEVPADTASYQPPSFKSIRSTQAAPTATAPGFFSNINSRHTEPAPEMQQPAAASQVPYSPPQFPAQPHAVEPASPAFAPAPAEAMLQQSTPSSAQQQENSALQQALRALSHEDVLQIPGNILMVAVALEATIEKAATGDAQALTDLKAGGLQALQNISFELQGTALKEMAKATKALTSEGYISLSAAQALVRQDAVAKAGQPGTTHTERLSARPAPFVPTP